MVNIEELEIIAVENSVISKKEEILARELKKVANIELKKARARELLMERMLESSNIKKKLAEKNHEIIERKMRNKDILQIPDVVLNNEKDYVVYNERIAKIQSSIAEIHKRIANLEREIAEERIKFANRRMELSKQRKELSKSQFSYIKKIKKSSPKDKILYAHDLWLNKQNDLESRRNRVMNKLSDIKKKENKIATLKIELSSMLRDFEKIKHISIE